eukprot:TRINITY_DN15714_c0_g1_i1.p1 TRINITY_DN15714_c0_g1~~TRINITY_DN15714_c0_g1_i1.p1  ORF type:complete len:190 (-),score=39.74 TRINITY_DN15714_c0_g1_i1:94-663(-)
MYLHALGMKVNTLWSKLSALKACSAAHDALYKGVTFNVVTGYLKNLQSSSPPPKKAYCFEEEHYQQLVSMQAPSCVNEAEWDLNVAYWLAGWFGGMRPTENAQLMYKDIKVDDLGVWVCYGQLKNRTSNTTHAHFLIPEGPASERFLQYYNARTNIDEDRFVSCMSAAPLFNVYLRCFDPILETGFGCR